ncbi:DNA-directed RNA polymerase subunit E'' [Candidatus Woesearchaeota archaeon]|jgi:DNA-directed RNA polymerase subunit E"|nr:DNA-directed RNA polymerase subunit E'' [Candidatus Woesearchaeota archaeon]MBT4322284.1 DNA-directed RNA polymerase subunit E'' [Candidatus Woesearchaeota archaeon]MBT4630873.1 DNA-directed RNA polymerase subunit E'' [Candidatus Woesearchaeota archaeon]
MAKKACKTCKILVEGNKCPLCQGNQFSESLKGKIIVLNAEKSEIAKKIGIKIKGEYAIKI